MQKKPRNKEGISAGGGFAYGEKMKLIVGLGNPGAEYKLTRHNAGVLAVEKLARNHELVFKKNSSFKSLIAVGEIHGYEVCLILPQTFMNLSGDAVVSVISKKRIALKDILIICDDVALSLGTIRIKPNGTAGGHNGLSSVIEKLECRDFARARLGIDHCGRGKDLAEYVLEPFKKTETKTLDLMLKKSVEAIELWIKEGIEKTMNVFNQKEKKEL